MSAAHPCDLGTDMSGGAPLRRSVRSDLSVATRNRLIANRRRRQPSSVRARRPRQVLSPRGVPAAHQCGRAASSSLATASSTRLSDKRCGRAVVASRGWGHRRCVSHPTAGSANKCEGLMEAPEPEVVWCDGDRWRDLTTEADVPLTVVSRAPAPLGSSTATGSCACRSRGGNALYGDRRPRCARVAWTPRWWR